MSALCYPSHQQTAKQALKTPWRDTKSFFKCFLLITLLAMALPGKLLAQAPVIHYTTPQSYTAGVAIAPLAPVNTGGAVTIGGAVIASRLGVLPVAGNGTTGKVNGTGAAASFNYLGGIALDAAGNIYVADQGNNLIRKITTAGVVTTLAGSGTPMSVDGTGTAASFSSPSGIAVDAAGNVYVGDINTGLIRKITPDGVVTTFASGTTYPVQIAIDGSGNLYVADGNTSIIKITPAGAQSTLASGFNSPFGVAVDKNNLVYVTDFTGRVFTVTQSGTVTVLAGSGAQGSANGTGTAASFNNPNNICVDAAGNVYVTDSSNGLIRKVTKTGVVTTLAGTGGIGNTNGRPSAATFYFPFGIAVDANGNLFESEEGGNVVRQIGNVGYSITPNLPSGLSLDPVTGILSGTPVTAFAANTYTVTAYNAMGSGTTTLTITASNPAGPKISYVTPQTYTVGVAITALSPANSGGAIPASTSEVGPFVGSVVGASNGTGTAASFNYPTGVAFDAAGNMFVADAGNNMIREVTTAGVVTTFAGSGTAGATDGTGTAASFYNPTALAFDPSGNMYVADENNHLVRKITPAGVVTTFAGNIANPGLINGTGTAASFRRPAGIAVDASGNVFVADDNNYVIREISPAAVVTTFAGSGGFGSTDGAGTAATFSHLGNIAMDAAGNIYVTDITNCLIRKVTPAGVVTTIAGTGNPGASNGTGTAASFNSPQGITLDASGNIYVGDYGNGLIRKITPAGLVSTLAGTGSKGSANGSGTAATFIHPYGLAMSLFSNKIYVVDWGSSLIRKITPLGYTISPGLPAGLNLDPTTGIISGIPAVVSPAANYSIFGSNYASTSAININISVLANGLSLANLTTTAGALSPAFTSTTVAYTASVTNATKSITITPTNSVATATIKVNSKTVKSGAASAAIALSVGPNTIPVVVTSSDGKTSDTYTVTVTRAQSSDASLSNFKLSNGTLNPVFAAGTYSYSATVSANLAAMTVTPTADDPTASITVNGVAVVSGTASQTLPLTIGANTITAVVTAQDGTQLAYTLTVTEPASTNNTLSALQISSGALSPGFTPAALSYKATVPIQYITFTPTVADATATVTVNGQAVTSGTESPELSMAVGSNKVTITVTAQSGATKTYTVTVTRSAPSADATLSALSLSSGTLTPAFAAGTPTYSASVSNATSIITLTPTTTNAYATVTVNGTAVTSGSASGNIALATGPNTIAVNVTAQDGTTTKAYTITVNRALSTNADLSALTTSSGALKPAFTPETTSYTESVGNAVTSITVTPTTADPKAFVILLANGMYVASGTAPSDVNLSVGANTVTVHVVAQDTSVSKNYTITITRAPSTNANLASLKISSGTLTPAFSSTVTSYSASVTNATASITVKAATVNNGATIKINGIAVTSGTAYAVNLAVGSNTINVVTTAQDGATTVSYKVTVTRASNGANEFVDDVSVTKPVKTPALADDGIAVRGALSPNGDGINDFLTIENISQYPDNKLSIVNRNGQLVYEATGYDNTSKVFDGHSNKNGKMQLPGTYFYQLDYTVNGVIKHKTGYLVLKY